MSNLFSIGGLSLGSPIGFFFIIIMFWSLFWKGVALWHSAKRKEKGWFIAVLLLNTLGILEIVYLFVVCKMKAEQVFGSAAPASKNAARTHGGQE
jgi:hypothetical protein